MKNEEIDDSNFNYEVYNGLNLYSPYLGEQYAKFKWNPLGDDFSLDISFIERYLENARNNDELSMPPFMENEPEKVLENFRLATKRNKELLKELQGKYDSGEYKSYKDTDIEKQVEEILFILKCRQKMLEISIGQLKSNSIDALSAYKNIRGLNKKLSQLLDEAYTEEYNKKVAMQNMLLWAQQRSQNFADLYVKMPFVFDAKLHNEKFRESNILENIVSNIKDVVNAFNGQSNMKLRDIPEFPDYDNSYQNTLQNYQNAQQYYQNIQQNSSTNTKSGGNSNTLNFS